jgi:hypothetical protein
MASGIQAARLPAYGPSPPLDWWRTGGRAEIDQLVAAHYAVGGTGPGRRTATQQINHALVVQLASQFQRYCRDLHGLCADAMVSAAPGPYRRALVLALTTGRKLDSQSAQPASLGSDFGRFGVDFWPAVDGLGLQFPGRRRKLEQVSIWRNAIAHQDFRRPPAEAATAGTRVDLDTFKSWRKALDQLAGGIDRAMYGELGRITSSAPW